MENKKEIIKDFIISVLIVIVITLILVILSYKKISTGKVIGEIENYNFTQEMKNELSASTEQNEVENVIVTYSIDSSTLKKYEDTNEYNKGKSNPFKMESSSSIINQSEITNNANITNYYYSNDNIK